MTAAMEMVAFAGGALVSPVPHPATECGEPVQAVAVAGLLGSLTLAPAFSSAPCGMSPARRTGAGRPPN